MTKRGGITRRVAAMVAGVLALAAVAVVALPAGERFDAAGLQALAAEPPDSLLPRFLGLNVLWPPGTEEALRQRFRMARELGVVDVRIDWEWRLAEPQPGVYDWSAFDRLVRVAKEEGVRLLPIVHYAPEWALVDAAKPATVYELAPAPGHYGAYADFLAASIARYGPGGTAPGAFDAIPAWQVWNEPNVAAFWGPAPDAEAFAGLMGAVAERLAPLRAGVRIVHAGLSRADLQFLWLLYEADPDYGETFDVMAVHPYTYGGGGGGPRLPAAMDEASAENAALGFVGSVDDPGFLGKVFNLQRLMAYRTPGGKPIWITEAGYVVGDHRMGVAADQQARLLTATIAYVAERLTDAPFGDVGPQALPARVERLYWFALQDYPDPAGLGGFGLYTAEGAARPSAEAFRDLAERQRAASAPPSEE